MNYEVVYLNEKIVVGLTTRTENSDPNMGNIIGSLWNDFYQKGVYSSIKNKVNEKALGIYSDYESDTSSKYNVTVACEVEKAEDIPSNIVIRIIPEGKYAKFVIHGHMQQAVAEFWEELWNMDIDRSYTFDFEEYQDSNMEDATVHIYIAIK